MGNKLCWREAVLVGGGAEGGCVARRWRQREPVSIGGGARGKAGAGVHLNRGGADKSSSMRFLKVVAPHPWSAWRLGVARFGDFWG